MNRFPALQLLTTADGSQTVRNTELGSTYHSMHGALTESMHVFIKHGLEMVVDNGKTEISIMEMGFGTGLNALVTAFRLADTDIQVDYHGLELYPVPEKVWREYQLSGKLRDEFELFKKMHQVPWDEKCVLTDQFNLTKHRISLLQHHPKEKFDLIYFDAFEPNVQPELWTEKVFADLFRWMNVGGILTTYCCKGDVRRAMVKAGFDVDKVPGPPGKREMIRAVRPLSLSEQ